MIKKKEKSGDILISYNSPIFQGDEHRGPAHQARLCFGGKGIRIRVSRAQNAAKEVACSNGTGEERKIGFSKRIETCTETESPRTG